VKKLRVELREGTVVQLPTTSGTSALGDSLETPAEERTETQLTAGTQ
jgi:hypothetical protein